AGPAAGRAVRHKRGRLLRPRAGVRRGRLRRGRRRRRGPRDLRGAMVAPPGWHRAFGGRGAPELGDGARTRRGRAQTGAAGAGPRTAHRGLAVAEPANDSHRRAVHRGELGGHTARDRRRSV
ncbi:MAG: hypothetical protein AVDCRST_MAG05-136, partial [uncultured Rubrobacteraceae bacterium]